MVQCDWKRSSLTGEKLLFEFSDNSHFTEHQNLPLKPQNIFHICTEACNTTTRTAFQLWKNSNDVEFNSIVLVHISNAWDPSIAKPHREWTEIKIEIIAYVPVCGFFFVRIPFGRWTMVYLNLEADERI